MSNTPSDAEIIELMRDGYNCRYNDEADHIEFARAVLAKWAAPQPALAPLSEKGECVSGCLHEERKDVMKSLVDGMQIQTHEKEILKVKMQLWRRVVGEIQASGVSQREAAHLLGVNQPRICSLISGKLDLFSTDMLIGFLAKCGRRLVVVTSQIDRGDTP